jgi:hypothetical protein
MEIPQGRRLTAASSFSRKLTGNNNHPEVNPSFVNQEKKKPSIEALKNEDGIQDLQPVSMSAMG